MFSCYGTIVWEFGLTKNSNRNYFYASNLTPLWVGSFSKKTREKYGKRVLEYLKANNILNKDGTPKYKGIIITCNIGIHNFFYH